MRRLLALVVVLAPSLAAADDDGEPVVVVNAAAELDGDVGRVARLRQALAARGLLVELPRAIEAALEGHAALALDLDAIHEAYAAFEYDAALALIDEQEARVLEGKLAGDVAIALAELTQWRGLIESARGEAARAIEWFRAAHRLNPALAVDPRYASPRVKRQVKQARRDAEGAGALDVTVEPAEARIAIDGGEARPIESPFELAAGIHLVAITAEGRAPYAELVEIADGETVTVEVALEPETRVHRAARLVDATAASPPGKARLERVRPLARVTGAERVLVVEDGGDDHVRIRVYDVAAGRVSRPLDLSGRASSAAIARSVAAALSSDDLFVERERRWYERWYVWAGVVAAAAGGFAYYEVSTREPSTIRGF